MPSDQVRGKPDEFGRLGAQPAAAGPWRSLRGGEIDARIELDLRLRRSAEGGLAVDPAGRAIGMAVFGPPRRMLVITVGDHCACRDEAGEPRAHPARLSRPRAPARGT